MLTWMFLAVAAASGVGCYRMTEGQRRVLAVTPTLVWLLGFLSPLLSDVAGRGSVLIAALILQGAGAALGLWALRTVRAAVKATPAAADQTGPA